jgi:hypothetical protein
VMESCSRLGLMPTLIGNGIALEQYPESGAQAMRGSQVTVRFGRPGEFVPASVKYPAVVSSTAGSKPAAPQAPAAGERN